MLCENGLLKYFWAEAVNTSCYVLKQILFWIFLNKTPYELWKDKKPNVLYFRTFGYKCFVLNNNKDNLGKFDTKANEGIFFGYSIHSKAYRVYNKRTLVVEESVHITFDEHNSPSKNIISDDVEEVEKSLKKLDIQPGSNEISQKDDEVQEASSSQQNTNEG